MFREPQHDKHSDSVFNGAIPRLVRVILLLLRMANESQILLELLEGIDNWNDLYLKLIRFNTSESETTKKKTVAGKIFEQFAKFYFSIDPTQSEFQECWLYDEIPLEIKERLKLPPADYGIDILLKDLDGKFCAVQCKFKNDQTKILSWTGDKIANVFALGTNCDKVFVISNCADVNAPAKNLTEGYQQFMNDSLSDIDPETFKRISETLKGINVSKKTKYLPRDHQKEAINAVVNHFNTNDRGQLILPCGAGKTLTALWIKERLKCKNALVLVPSLALLKQIKNDWARQRNAEYRYLCVCSEKDIDKRSDEAVTHTYEIGGNVSSDQLEIAKFLSKKEDKVIFSTYQSIGSVVDALSINTNFRFDIVICDEAHRTAGSKTKTTFTLVHNNDKIRADKRLYMTATPRVVSTNMKTRLKNDYALICDMSNPDIYGDEAFRMTFGEAIEKGILVDYKILGIGVTDQQVKKFIEERDFVSDATAEDIAHNFALDMVMNKYQIFHGLTFHSRVSYAQEFAERHNEFFKDVYSKSVNGKQSTTYRKQVLDQFESSEKGVVSNARCLTEGVDVPIIDLIYFCDPKNSKIDIVQSTGRALRKDKSGKKRMGYIIVPIFHHSSESVETEIKKKPIFNYLIQVIRSMCDQDERIDSEINKIAFGKGKRNSSRVSVEYIEGDTEKVIRFEGLETRIKESLFDEVIDKAKSNWEQSYLELKNFHKEHGHIKVPKVEMKSLNYWIGTQKRLNSKGQLDPLKKSKLEQLGITWWNTFVKGWEGNLQNLIDFKKDHGHLDIPRSHKLGYWLYYQMLQFRRGNLDTKRHSELLKVGVKFSSSNVSEYDQAWNNQYSEIKDYYDKNGNSNITIHYPNPTLYNWVKMQRLKYHKGKLKKDRINRLNKIEFPWVAPKENFKLPPLSQFDDKKWMKKYSLLQKFKKKYGHCNVKQSSNEFKGLGRWVNDQRLNFNKDNMPENRKKLLDEIGFIWDAKYLYLEEAWNTKFGELKKFHEENGHFNVTQNGDRSLYYWLYRIRTKGESIKHIQDLKELGFDIKDIPVREL